MKWVIVTETYREFSNGVKLMHNICDKLNSIGEEAYIVFTTPHPIASQRKLMVTSEVNCVNLKLRTPLITKEIIQNNLQDVIAIYHEGISGNPLNSKKIVRFLGNKPENTNPTDNINFNKNEFILSFSNMYTDKANAYLFNTSIDNFFYEDNNCFSFKNRTLDILYHGKAFLFGDTPTYDNTLLVTREWPKKRNELAMLLKQCRYFYTLDPWTQTNGEALAAGAIPVFLQWKPWSEKEIDSSECGSFPRGQLLEIKDNKIYATVDIEKFNEQRKIFLNNVKYYEETWDNRFKDVVQQIKQYFS